MAINTDGSSSPASLQLNVKVAVVSVPELYYWWWNTNELLKDGGVLAVSQAKMRYRSTQGAPYVQVGPSVYEEMPGVLGHDQQEIFSGYKRAGQGSGTNEFVQLHIPLQQYHTMNCEPRCGEKTSAHGKGEACDTWTEQVCEPHLNNTHTHFITLTHLHPLYVCGASSSGFSRY